MKKQKKQNLLSTIIAILVLALAILVGSIVYEETINMSKQPEQNTTSTKEEEKESITQDDVEGEPKENNEETTSDEEYVGEEEQETNQEDTTKSKDEKAIDLAKQKWGNDDSVTFSIVDKSGSKYRVAVTSQTTEVLQWYEVDTETWEISEF